MTSTVRLHCLRIPFSLSAMTLGRLSCALCVWQSDLLTQPIDAIAAQAGEETAKPIGIASDPEGMAASTSLAVGGLLSGSGLATLLGSSDRTLNSLLKRTASEA